ncbi:Bromodomain adjacent to zinc finger domain 1A [Quillaja saponaria]|uniref:Bromodomain adjacent to zinc finger domain 1A n=1 Tax=Quillaja saponaria TaxID=32244 RepID=A0AAD7PZB0_QUISA|nr:Bromodomain adjacent to zinc finger domain 1A [Quillaja saponaria]
MSSEGDSPSAPPFKTSDVRLADGTIMPIGEEPKYRLGKGKVLPPSLAYHPTTSSSSENTEYESFEGEDEATAMARFSPKWEEDEESDDDVAIFWPQTNISAVNTIENVMSDQKFEVVRRRYFEPVGAKIYKVSPYGDRPHQSLPNTLCFYEEYLKAGVRYPFHPFIVKVLNALGICIAQIALNGWGFLITFIGVCHTLQIHMGLPQEQEAAKVRAATRRRLGALKERAEKASNKGKRQIKEGRRAPKQSRASSASQRDMAEVSSVSRAREESQIELTEGVLPLTTIPTEDRQGMPPRLKEGKGGALLEGADWTRRLFSSQGSCAHFSGYPGGCLHQRHPRCGLCHSKREYLAHGRSYDRRSSSRECIHYQAICWRAVHLISGILTEKVEAEGRAATEHFESLQAEVLCLGAEVEGWLKKCRELNEGADLLRKEIERYRAFESEEARLREEKDDEIARLRTELEVSKEEARTAVENFKNSDDCRRIIYDHDSRLYANRSVGCRVTTLWTFLRRSGLARKRPKRRRGWRRCSPKLRLTRRRDRRARATRVLRARRTRP